MPEEVSYCFTKGYLDDTQRQLKQPSIWWSNLIPDLNIPIKNETKNYALDLFSRARNNIQRSSSGAFKSQSKLHYKIFGWVFNTLLSLTFYLPVTNLYKKHINFRKLLIPFKNLLDIFKELVFLTHFWQMLLFYTPRKTPENRWFSVFSRGYKNGALSWNSVSNVDQKFTKKCYYDFGRHYDQLFDTSKQQNFKVFWGLNFLKSVFSFPEEKINRIKFILVLSRL